MRVADEVMRLNWPKLSCPAEKLRHFNYFLSLTCSQLSRGILFQDLLVFTCSQFYYREAPLKVSPSCISVVYESIYWSLVIIERIPRFLKQIFGSLFRTKWLKLACLAQKLRQFGCLAVCLVCLQISFLLESVHLPFSWSQYHEATVNVLQQCCLRLNFLTLYYY